MSTVPAVGASRVRIAPILTATVLTVLMLWLFGRAAQIFLLLFGSIIISLYLGAVADFFDRRLHTPRRGSIALAVLVSLAGLIGLVWLLVPPVIQQTQQLVRVLPTFIEGWEASIERTVARFPGLQEMWRPGEHKVLVAVYEQLSSQFSDIVPKVFSIVHLAIDIFAVAIMGLYLALQPALYREWLIALFPPIHRDLVRDVLGDLATNLRSWIVAQLLGMSIIGAFTALGLYLLDVPYWLTFGLFTGVVAIVPFFGTLVSTLLPAVFVLGGAGYHDFGPGGHALLVVLLGTVVHLLESNVVMPLITAHKVELPPVLTIMAVLIVGTFLGPGGLLVAVPLLAAIMVVVRRILVNRIYEGQGFRRSARDRALVLRVPAPEGGVFTPPGPPVDLISLAETSARATAA